MAGFQPSRPTTIRPRQPGPGRDATAGHDVTKAHGDATSDEGAHE
ncbi:hypothetical protein [Halosolutus halophilus]|nr:hypothetical protein [Halosolutus halophilus]